MSTLFSYDDVRSMAMSDMDRAMFGPNTEHNFLAFEGTKSIAPPVAAWLKNLPCPVIAIGHIEDTACVDVILDNSLKLRTISKNIKRTPFAAMALVQLLRLSENLPIEDALTTESFAYAALQNGSEFHEWLATYKRPEISSLSDTHLISHRNGHTLSLTLNRPEVHNAIDVSLRDALCETLDLALMDTAINTITLTGNGSAFSIGGDVAEFGLVSDPAAAHWIRSLRLPAWRLARLSNRVHVHVNGAAIGAGAEIAAFGTHVTASPHAWFQLPELKYGLIPGAGGTASLPRRIGRHRTAYMALSMEKIRAQTALEWGLIDAVSS